VHVGGHASNDSPALLPTEESLASYRAALHSGGCVRDWMRRRALRCRVVDQAELGYDGERNALVIPVRDRAGALVNVRRRFLHNSDPKIVGARGHGTQLYPHWALNRDPRTVFVAEGEIDALTLIQAGVAAVTSTGGRAQSWLNRPEWIDDLVGRTVGVVYDADALPWAELRVEELRAGGVRAFAIDVNATGYGGKTDVNDLVAIYGWSDRRLRDYLFAALLNSRRRSARR
jgi:hypothetical protein